MFLNPFPNAFGLEINDLSVKVVQLRNISRRQRGPAYELVAARKITLPHGLITNGIIQEPERVRTYIRHLLRKKNKKGNLARSSWVVASLPDTQGFIKLIGIEKSAEDVLEDDVKIAAQKHVPLDAGSYNLDWQIMPKHSESDETSYVLLAAIPSHIANIYTYLLESVGLSVAALEPQSLSIARSMITVGRDYEDEGRAILNLSAAHTSLTVYDHDHIQFSHCLGVTGEMMTSQISSATQSAYEVAEEKKVKHGLKFSKNSKVWRVLSGQIDTLINEIEQSLQFYYSHFPNPNKITALTLCGGGSNLPGLVEILKSKLKIEVSHGKSWKNLLTKKSIPVNDQESRHYAAAIGLALRAADNPFFRSDAI